MRLWALGVLLVMVACSSTVTPTQTGPPDAFGPTSAPSQRYASLDEMLEVLGMGREVASGGVGNNAGALKDFVEISVPDGVVDIYLFRDRKQMESWLPQMASTQVLYGPNWIVVPFASARGVFSALGGTLTPPSP